MNQVPNHGDDGDFGRLLRGIISRSVRLRGAALVVAAVIVGLGIWSLQRLPLDVTPDISNVQVQVLTAVPDLSPEEIENSVTRPLELEMFGLPRLEQVRSLTRFGISQVCLIFADGTDLFRARQMVAERMAQAMDKLPPGLVPRLAPPSSGLGEVFTYALAFKTNASPDAEYSEDALRKLKLVNEFVVKPCLKAVNGVAEINTTGGYDQEMVVSVDPTQLNQYGVDLNDIANILQRNAAIGGGALIEREGSQFYIRSRSRTQLTNDFSHLCIRLSLAAESIPLSQVATISIGSGIRLGAATLNGHEAVLGTVLMLNGENANQVARAVRGALAEAQARLPAGLELRPLYDRSELVDHVLGTVKHNLALAAALVLAVLFSFLRNWRAALIVASVLLLSFAVGITNMAALGIMGSLMTLGAIDFGILVDDAIVMVENVTRSLRAGASMDRTAAIIEACCQVRKPMLVGMLVIIGAYVPVLLLGGVEGRMFRPLAQSMILLLGSSLILTLFLAPALCALGLQNCAATLEPPFLNWLRRQYQNALSWSRRWRWAVYAAVLLGAVGAAALAPRLGADFMPALDEEWLVVEVQRPPTTSLPESLALEEKTEEAIRAAIPEIKDCFARIGMSQIATDPQGANQNDIYISFRPRSEWRQSQGHRLTKAGLAAEIQRVIEQKVPGQELELNQPIAVRFDELLEGVRTDVAVKVFGDDYDKLDALADQVAAAAKSLPGVGEVVVDQAGRTPTLEFQPNRAAMLHYMATSDQINNAAAIALAGRIVGRIDDGQMFYPLAVRVAESFRTNREALNVLPLRAADGSLVLGLGNLGSWVETRSVTAITRDQAARREAVLISLENGNAVDFVNRLRDKLQAKLPLPEGYRLEYSGAYKNWESGSKRLALGGLVFLVASLLLIFGALRNWRQTVLVALGIPFALAGGIYGLWFRDLPLTLPAAVGLVTLGGLSLLNGMVLITCFNELIAGGFTPLQAALESASRRLRPVLMTALVASLGFAPMAFSTGIGAELQRPLATVVITGVLSSTFLTLLLLPLLLPRTAVSKSLNNQAQGTYASSAPAAATL